MGGYGPHGPRPPHRHFFFGRRRHYRDYDYGYGGHYSSPRRGGGSLARALSVVIVIIIIVAVFKTFGNSSQKPSNVSNRAPITNNTQYDDNVPYQDDVSELENDQSNEPIVIQKTVTDYFTDELNWNSDPQKLMEGLQYFEEKTGVQPYLLITDYVNESYTPSDSDFETFAGDEYDRLFKDEDHLLVIFHEYEPSEYTVWYVCGNDASETFDDAAADIMFDQFDEHYTDNTDEDTYFITVFKNIADEMAKSK